MHRKALSALTVLFFMMGFITCLNDILVPYLKKVFELTYTQAALVQFFFFMAYGLASIPASKMIEKWGYQKGMVIGFVTTALGCLLFFPAVSFHTYALFLFALFILASGIVVLQVAGNPYVSVLGPVETSSSRLTMTQAFNSLGTFLAPFFGSALILSKIEDSGSADAVKYPYLIIAFTLIIIAIVLSRLTLPKINFNSDNSGTWKNALSKKGLWLGMLGIFAYVGAEVTIGSFFVSFIQETTAMIEVDAANLVAFYWGGAMVGRFLGIFTLKKFTPGRVLFIHSLMAIALILIAVRSSGMFSVYALMMVGFCNSIMFPTIFTLALQGHEEMAEKASGLMSTAILGGAIIPILTGLMADSYTLKFSLLIPAVCYFYIAYFGLIRKN